MIIDRICRQCESKFKGGPRAWYCPSCRAERIRERDREHKHNGALRKLGSISKCVVCGKDYTVDGGLQKYCKDCAKEQIKKIDKVQGLEYYNRNKDIINPQRYNKRRKPKNIECAECGKTFTRKGNGKYCSHDCRKTRNNRMWREMYHKKKANPKNT